MEIKPTEFAWIIAIVSAVSTLTGVIVSSTFSYFNARATRKSEETRHLKEIVINAAIESWKLQIEINKIQKQTTTIVPLDEYIIHMIKFADVILAGELTEANIESKMREVRSITHKAHELTREFSKK